jgi:hypothetical protein
MYTNKKQYSLQQGKRFLNKRSLEGFANNGRQPNTGSYDNSPDLKTEYERTLKEYQDSIREKETITKQFLDRTNQNNPYLSKNIQFLDGTIAYVTEQGYVKPYTSESDFLNTAGKNNCPGKNKTTKLNMSWDPTFISGAKLATNPELIIGDPMISGQSCGNAGSSLFVDKLMASSPTVDYVGCYNKNVKKTETRTVPIMNDTNTLNGYQSIASSVYNNNNYYGAWNAFNQNSKTFWHSSSNKNENKSYNGKTGNYEGITFIEYVDDAGGANRAEGEYVQIILPKATPLTRYELQGRQDCCGKGKISSRAPNSWLILGKKNNVWTQVDKRTNEDVNYDLKTYSIPKSDAYDSYVFLTTNVGSQQDRTNTRTSVQISQWNLFTVETSVDDNGSTMQTIGLMNYETCLNNAVYAGNKYFSLTNVNEDGVGTCSITNDIAQAQQYGEAESFNEVELWNSDTQDKGKLATFTQDGSLVVTDGTGNVVFSTPKQTDEDNASYFLSLQKDGNMCIYKGVPGSIEKEVWNTMTVGKQQEKNRAMVANKNKYKRNTMQIGDQLMPNDFISSQSGDLVLMMKNDGNLSLFTYKSTNQTCKQDKATNRKYGNDFFNAVYEIKEYFFPENIGKVGIVDENAKLYEYKDDKIKFSREYSLFGKDIDYEGYSLDDKVMGNVSIDSCKKVCNDDDECAGFIFDGVQKTCYPKSKKIYPFNQRNIKHASNKSFYLRKRVPKEYPTGFNAYSSKTVDTIQYENYSKIDALSDNYGLINATFSQQKKVDDLETRLNLMSKQLNDYSDINSKLEPFSSMRSMDNDNGTERLKVFKKSEAKLKNAIQNLTKKSNVDLILEDSNIVVLQKNSEYILWSILATAIVLVAIKVMG